MHHLETCWKGMAAVVRVIYILVYWRARQLPHRLDIAHMPCIYCPALKNPLHGQYIECYP